MLLTPPAVREDVPQETFAAEASPVFPGKHGA